MPVEVAQRQPRELAVDLLAEPVDGPLGDAGHDVGLHPAEGRAQHVEDRQEPEDPPELREVDADAGRQRQAPEEVGELVLALGVELGDHLLLRRPGGELPADGPLEDLVGRLAQDLRPDHGEGHADDREQHDERDQRPLRSEMAEQPAERAPEVGRLADRHAHPHHPGAAARAGWGTAGWGTAGRRTAGARSPAHPAASSIESCE